MTKREDGRRGERPERIRKENRGRGGGFEEVEDQKIRSSARPWLGLGGRALAQGFSLTQREVETAPELGRESGWKAEGLTEDSQREMRRWHEKIELISISKAYEVRASPACSNTATIERPESS